MNDYPVSGMAAWHMTGIFSKADHEEASLGELVIDATAAQCDGDFRQATAEYQRWGCLCQTDAVFMLDQVSDLLDAVEIPKTTKTIEKEMNGMPRLHASA